MTIEAMSVGRQGPAELALRLNALRGTAVYAAYLAAPDKIDAAIAELQEELQGFDPSAAIFQLVQVLAEPPPMVADQLRERKLLRDACCIVGGEKNQRRDPGLAHFVRDDDAWFDFTITVRQRGALELLAYNFEIRFPSAMGSPFLRFDLNLPEHRNEDRELRSHLHAGSDDLYVPAPVMTPFELVGLFVNELRRPPDRERWRKATPFEVEWFLTTHHELASRGPGTSGG